MDSMPVGQKNGLPMTANRVNPCGDWLFSEMWLLTALFEDRYGLRP